MARLIQQEYTLPQAGADIMRGGAIIVVSIFAGVVEGQRIEVDVYR